MAIRSSYNNNPANSNRDAARFYVGDTSIDRPLLDDREVDFAVAIEPSNMRLAAALLADVLAGRFAAKPDISVGPVRKSFGKIAESYRQRAKDLRAESNKRVSVSFPATSHSAVAALKGDSDITTGEFSIGMFDNKFAQQLDNEFEDAGFNGW